MARTRTAILGVCALLLSGYAAFLAHPEPLFSYSLTCSNITFFAHRPLPIEIVGIAARVARRVATSELRDSAIVQRVFIVERPWVWILLNGPYARAMARNVEIGNAILVPALDVSRERVRHFDGRTADAVATISHECVHTLVQRRIGLLKLWRMPWWQREGYPEYIASERGTRSDAPPAYRDAARRWKYFLEERGMTFDEVVRF